jgi:glycine amidinotransferase/scyllo-inosamine-4-phosphate amidinotransferase 1
MITPNANNEWGQLKKVILGTVNRAQIPTVKDKSLHCIDYAHYTPEQFSKIPTGAYPLRVLEETEEDLQNIETVLKDLGVEVIRPPRDGMLVIKDKVIATPMTLAQRRDEADKYKQLFTPESWVEFPKHSGSDLLYDRSDLSKSTLTNIEPVFDAANIIRANNDLLYLVSNTGNKLGAEYLENWLHQNVSEDYKVHLAENVYAYIHIDTTFVFLREGLLMVNPARVNMNHLPDFLQNWSAINAPEPYPTQVMNDWCPASPWLGMNILSINENLVLVEEHQINLMKLLKKVGIESIPIKLRHSRTLSGGPHCITLDVERE